MTLETQKDSKTYKMTTNVTLNYMKRYDTVTQRTAVSTVSTK